MTVTQLAIAANVATDLGRALTSSETAIVAPMLDKASELFRKRSGQNFTTATSTVRLKVNGGRVRLTQAPVTAVASVVRDDGTAVDYTRHDQWLSVADMASHEFVTVTYSHGGTVPDDVRLCVSGMVSRILSLDPRALKGFTQFAETRGPLSDSGTFAAWAVGAAVRLAPDDVALAEDYRAKAITPTVWVGSA